jgi:hypothetical protein
MLSCQPSAPKKTKLSKQQPLVDKCQCVGVLGIDVSLIHSPFSLVQSDDSKFVRPKLDRHLWIVEHRAQ